MKSKFLLVKFALISVTLSPIGIYCQPSCSDSPSSVKGEERVHNKNNNKITLIGEMSTICNGEIGIEFGGGKQRGHNDLKVRDELMAKSFTNACPRLE